MRILESVTMQGESAILRHKDAIVNNTPFEEQRLITDLVAELAIALHNKANLESENAALKLEHKDLQFKIAEYERRSNEEKNKLIEDVKESQVEIQKKDVILAKKSVEQVEEQKKHIMEVNELRNVYNKQKDLFEKREMELQNTINKLKADTIQISKNYQIFKENAETLQNKYIKYKSKVKYAIGIINTLAAALRKCSKKSVTCNKETQTSSSVDRNLYEHHTSCCSLHSQCIVETDKIVLAELFFKQHPSDNNAENVFFLSGNKSNDNLNDVY